MANGYAEHSAEHTAVLDMQVAGADTAERNTHNGITRALQFGLWLVDQLELAVGYVGIGEHRYSQIFIQFDILNTPLENTKKYSLFTISFYLIQIIIVLPLVV